MMKKLTAVLLLTAMTAGLAACGSNKGADTNTDAPAQNEGTEETVTTETSGAAQNADIQGTITLAAAASLEKSFTEHLIPMFEEQYPEVSIEGTYDSSGKLQSQIEAGADVDIFFSAALKQMEALQEEGYIAEDASVDLLENKIVLIVPAGKENGYTSFEDIVNADMIAIGDPESVPAGQYGKEALENLDLWSSVEGKLSLGTNVTEVLNWVAEGSADTGIVYATDAASMTDKVSVVAEAPEGSVSKVIYPVAELKETKNKDAADVFMEFLQSDEALDVFKVAGFTVNSQQ
ncbi:Molybdate-binding periplasmic protein precursor [Roseburia inulinivorans]|uniref:Molybdate-binding periplasmic protein n=2 Tax=Roseburia inulinivorans TaxID=360807 RepID=A0A174FEA1_9FIRM|nr:molybdate ABC transporter substrate-binding protein [Roseburia inulinivorans]CUO46660.1 Molybdate-binding periplasmic protein precursor [Roseburia inulinivorans]